MEARDILFMMLSIGYCMIFFCVTITLYKVLNIRTLIPLTLFHILPWPPLIRSIPSADDVVEVLMKQ